MILFALASLLTALAPSEGVLVTGRALQGVGGAVLTTTSLALLRVTWAGRGRPRDRPLDVADEPRDRRWAGARRLHRPDRLVALGLRDQRAARRPDGRARARRTGEDERGQGRATLDLVGSALVAVALTGISFAIVEVRERGLEAVLPFLVVGIWPRSSRSSSGRSARAIPSCRPRSCAFPGSRARTSSRSSSTPRSARTCSSCPVYLQFLGFSPTLSGLVFAPPSIGLILLAPALRPLRRPERPAAPDRLRRRHDRDGRAAAPARDDPGRRVDVGARERLPLRVGLPASSRPITAAALSPAPEDLAGVAAGLNQTVARVGGILSVAAIGAIAGVVFTGNGGTGDTPFDPAAAGAVRDAGVDAFHAVVVCIASLAFVASGLAALFLRGRRQRSTPSSVRSATLRSNPPA